MRKVAKGEAIQTAFQQTPQDVFENLDVPVTVKTMYSGKQSKLISIT